MVHVIDALMLECILFAPLAVHKSVLLQRMVQVAVYQCQQCYFTKVTRIAGCVSHAIRNWGYEFLMEYVFK